MNEMKNVGLRQEEIYLFSLLGIGFWAVLTWLFVDRYQNIEDSTTRSDNIRNINIIVLSFHLLTLLFTLFESYDVNKVITFDENKIAGFIKSDISWHSVNENIFDYDRRAIVINLFEIN